MSDVVVTCPQASWSGWLAEGDLPGIEAVYESHFWISRLLGLPRIEPGERVYIVAWGKLRGYAPLVRMESRCELSARHSCLVREGGAVAVTIPTPIRGFRGWHYRTWDRQDEIPFPDWMVP